MRTTPLPILASAAAAMVFVHGVTAQTNATFVFTSSNTVSPATPTTTVGIWATWDDLPLPEYLFSGADYDLTAGDGLFSNPVNVLQPLNILGTSAGTTVGNMVLGARNTQLHIPAGVGFFGNPDNPILLATYDWTTADFTPRSVRLETSNTTGFDVAALLTGSILSLFPQAFAPGSGGITVVPAPAAWFVLCVPMAMAMRRRRV